MMNSSFKQQQKQSQVQTFAPQLRHSLKILQAPTLELRNTLLEELQTNPLLEELPLESISLESSPEETSNPTEDLDHPEELDFKEEYDTLLQLDEDWREHYAQETSNQTYTSEDADRHQHMMDSIVTENSLQNHLMGQAQLTNCSPDELSAIEFLIGSLDDRGFLKTPLEEIAHLSSHPLHTIQSAHQILKTLDPIGIGATSVQECLLIELAADGLEDELGAIIIKDHFDLLLRRRIPEIARALKVEVEDVQEALHSISSLDPAPGRNFTPDTNQTVNPDITFSRVGDLWNATLNTDYIPRLRLSKSYRDLLSKPSLSKEEKEYIKDKMRSGKFVISALEQRQKTLQRIADKIIELQYDFFEGGISALHPLTMSHMGELLELHETTISRAIANKFAKTPHGIVELKFFFTSGYTSDTGQTIANTSVKDEIAKIIEAENPAKPLSDQKISDLLKEQNMKVARRTVAKYREELGILPTNLRRQY